MSFYPVSSNIVFKKIKKKILNIFNSSTIIFKKLYNGYILKITKKKWDSFLNLQQLKIKKFKSKN